MLKVNNINKGINYDKNKAHNLNLDLVDVTRPDEHNGIGIVEIFDQFMMWDVVCDVWLVNMCNFGHMISVHKDGGNPASC